MHNIKKQKTLEYPYTDMIRITPDEPGMNVGIDILYNETDVHVSLYNRTEKRFEHLVVEGDDVKMYSGKVVDEEHGIEHIDGCRLEIMPEYKSIIADAIIGERIIDFLRHL